MAHVIVDTCTKDSLCVDACPNDCIHPTKDEIDWSHLVRLNINPEECLDCGTCIELCPTNSIVPAENLSDAKKGFAAKNAAYFR